MFGQRELSTKREIGKQECFSFFDKWMKQWYSFNDDELWFGNLPIWSGKIISAYLKKGISTKALQIFLDHDRLTTN